MPDPLIVGKLREMKEANVFANFIDYIRFPKFRNLEPNARIDFSFPFTVFVGPNGCGKSSAMQALFGAPAGKSTGTYWFETALDPILQQDDDRHCFIYSAKGGGAASEVLKTRILTPGKPERWDTSESLEKYGMLSPGQRLAKPVEKDVVFINFRNAHNAFEKKFNEERPPSSGIQDWLRTRTRALSRVLAGRKPGRGYGSKTHDPVVTLSSEELAEVSKILGRTYVSTALIKHRLFGMWGYSVKMRTEYGEYSEAFAGSGESAVVLLVREVLAAKESSLLLLDEPETSLHPGAQALVQDFLLRICKSKKHQVVTCSHSPEFVRGLPPEAIKVFTPSLGNKFRIVPNISSSEAFFFLGLDAGPQCCIFVEDKLAALMVEAIIDKLPVQARSLFKVRFFPGGHTVMKTDAEFAVRAGSNFWYLFDGDALTPSPFDGNPLSKLRGDEVAQPDLGFNRISQMISDWLGCVPKFTAEGSEVEKAQRKLDLAVNYASFAEKHFGCFPSPGADTAIWNENVATEIARIILGQEIGGQLLANIQSLGNAKSKFRELSASLLSSSKATSIEMIHRMFITNWATRQTDDENAIAAFLERCRNSVTQHEG